MDKHSRIRPVTQRNMATDHASVLYGFRGARFPDGTRDNAGLSCGVRRKGSQDEASGKAEQADNLPDGDDMQSKDVGSA